jgi:hypothetical protein
MLMTLTSDRHNAKSNPTGIDPLFDLDEAV